MAARTLVEYFHLDQLSILFKIWRAIPVLRPLALYSGFPPGKNATPKKSHISRFFIDMPCGWAIFLILSLLLGRFMEGRFSYSLIL